MNVSEYIVKYLEEKKIKNVFLVTGGGMMFMVNALSKSKINLLHNHHEQASFFSTDGYARSTNTVGVSFATSGPGITNIVTGVMHAWHDSIPVIIFGGQSKKKETIVHTKHKKIRQLGTFEANSVEILKPITKFSISISKPEDIKFYLDKAFHISQTGRPGPVFLEIPLDVQSANIDNLNLNKKKYLVKKEFKKKLISSSINKTINMLKKSKRPLVLAGYGVRASNSVKEFQFFLKKYNLPAITTQFSKDILEYDSKFFIGHTGPKGDRAGNNIAQQADFILIIGCSLHSQTIGWEKELFAPKAKKIQIDIDKEVLKKDIPNINFKYNIDVKEFITEMIKSKSERKFSKWNVNCLNYKKKFQVINEPHKRNKKNINYYDFVNEISKFLPNKSTVVTDAGAAYYILGQGFKLKKNQRYIVCGSHGTMGYALSAANGVSLNKKTASICITGDGSLMTNLHDLSCTSYNNLNVKIFLINNNGYMSIRNNQKEFFGKKTVGTDKKNGVFFPNFKKTASLFNINYLSCKSLDSLKKITKKIFSSTKPIIIEVFCSDTIIIPTVKSSLNKKGKLVSNPINVMFPYLNNQKK